MPFAPISALRLSEYVGFSFSSFVVVHVVVQEEAGRVVGRVAEVGLSEEVRGATLLLSFEFLEE